MKNKVAIVEDESIVALDMSTCLKAGGYEVSFVTDQGEKALELIESSKPDIVIIDIELKGEMNGVETAKVIRERYNIPHVFLTAYEDDEILSQLENTSPSGYIIKPFSDSQLLDLLKKVLG